MRKIAHLTTVHPRSDTRIFIKECQALSDVKSYKVYLLVADGEGDLDSNKVSTLDCGKPTGGKLGRSLLGTWHIFRKARSLRPHVLHLHDPELIPACLLLRCLGHKVIYDVHEDFPKQIRGMHWLPPLIRWPSSRIIFILEWLACRFFTQIIAATPKIAERFPSNKTNVVQNFPIAHELTAADHQPFSLRPKQFAFVGGVTPIRGVSESVEAIGLLPSDTSARLTIAGGFKPAGFENHVRSLAGWQRTDYIGWAGRDEVAKLLGQSVAGLVVFLPLPNHVDAYPNKMFEYMSAGLPVIASDFPLWRRILTEADCGLLVDPENPNSIAQAMQWILDHPDKAEAMGARGRVAVRDIYNWHREAEKLKAIYRDLLNA